jgi:acyl transferase domain-containing protein
MKGALMTEAAIIPGVAGFKKLNPKSQLMDLHLNHGFDANRRTVLEKEWNVKVNVNTIPWPSEFSVRRASVSSFGYGGTNGHVIVEAVESLYPFYEHGKPRVEATYNNISSRPLLIVMSAHDKATLTRNINAHANVARNFYLMDLAYTLNCKRSRFKHFAYTVASESQESNILEPSSFVFGSPGKKVPGIGFIFTGQGAQWAGMAVEAMQTFPSFLETIRALDRVLQHLPLPPIWKIEEILLAPKDNNRLSEAEIAQPICTAIQIAIVDLFAYWDIDPLVTVGHSSGEIAAAYAAGLLSAPEAIIAAFYRGFSVKQVAPVGAMLAVGVGVDKISGYLSIFGDDVVVACENSPSSITLSGTIAGIQHAKRVLDGDNIFARELRTGRAYHSPQMCAVSQLYERLLLLAYQGLDANSLAWRQPRGRMISSVTGQEFVEEYILTQYWSENLRNRVFFDTAVTTLGNHPDFSQVSVMIEIGPHSALAGPFKQICTANQFEKFKYVPTFVRNANNAAQLLKTAGELLLNGYNVDLEKINAIATSGAQFGIKSKIGPRLLVDLPPYQWNYEKRYWAEPRFSHEQRNIKYPRHDLLGRKIVGLSDRSHAWRNQLRHRDVPWLKDHSVSSYYADILLVC